MGWWTGVQSRPWRRSHRQPCSFSHCDTEKTRRELRGRAVKLDREVGLPPESAGLSRPVLWSCSLGPSQSHCPRWAHTWEGSEPWRGEEGRLRARGRDGVTGAPECRAALSLWPASPPGPAFLTFVLRWVVDVEVPVPHDRQLHRQVVDLHPLIGILQPGRG